MDFIVFKEHLIRHIILYLLYVLQVYIYDNYLFTFIPEYLIWIYGYTWMYVCVLPYIIFFHLKWTNVLCMCSVTSDTLQSMDGSPPGFSVHGIFQARTLEWVDISSSRGSSQPRDQTCVSCVFYIGRQILYHLATWEAYDLWVW